MKASKVLTIVLLVSLLANAHGVCLLGLLQLNLFCNILLPLCDLDTLLSLLCGGDTLLQINVASGNHVLQLSSPTNLASLSITTTGSATLTVSLAAAVTVLNDVVLTGAGVILKIEQGVIVNVTGNTNVGTGSTLQVAGHLGVQGYTQIKGNLNMQGTKTPGSNQNAWIHSCNPVNVSGTTTSPATVTGNGGIGSSMTVYGAAKSGTANTDSHIYITNDLQVSSNTLFKLGGNVTVNGLTQVYGRLHLDGQLTSPSTSAYSHLFSPSSQVYFAGSSPTDRANLTGNGVIHGDVNLGENTAIKAGNSPGVIRVNGGLMMSPSSYMEIEVASSGSFDQYIVNNVLYRNGHLYMVFQNGYLPNGNDRFTFSSHSNATGAFVTVSGSNPYVFAAYSTRATMFIFDDPQAPAYCTCALV